MKTKLLLTVFLLHISYILIAQILPTSSYRQKLCINEKTNENAFEFQNRSNTRFTPAPLAFQKQFSPKTFIPSNRKSPGYYSKDDWSAIIDSTWGIGLLTDQKLHIFDQFWGMIDQNFACFQDLEVNWNSLRTLYRNEISGNVSRGRFAAIMNHLSRSLKEAHTNCEDKLVCWNTALNHGVPLMVVGGWGNNGHFGAGLTPLPDSSLLVYKADSLHPLGLVPGDIVLGYDGIPWKILYEDLISAELPITGWWWGSSESSYIHSWLISAGMNWHLFDTIYVVKYETGDTLHLSVTPLIGQNMSLFCTEQIDIPGVPMPDYYGGEIFSYGIIDDTQIGYIYGWGWFWDAEAEFYNAVYELMHNYETIGLIIDFRMNYGGSIFLSNEGLSLLFNSVDTTIGMAKRSNPHNHLAMMPYVPPSVYVIPGDSSTYYNKPIAVLTGPGALSSGDQVALRMKFHLMTRFFGKSTNTAFNGPQEITFTYEDWYSRYARTDAYLVTDPDEYLTHDEFEVDEEVWHNPDDVAIGEDAVVKAAIAWIDSLYVGTKEITDQTTSISSINYPNPFVHSSVISYILSIDSYVELVMFDMTGKEIATLVKEYQQRGTHQSIWNAEHLPAGIYFYRLQAGNQFASGKMIVVK